MKNVQKLPKEQLNTAHFSQAEVLNNPSDRMWRLHKLQRALLLGNTEHIHANIIFKDEEDVLQQVEATVWSVTENSVLLKGGMFIPIRAIVDIEY